MPNKNKRGKNVTVSLQLEGRYDDVMSKLSAEEKGGTNVEPFLTDLRAVLDTVERTGGGTRSVLVENLPRDMAVTYDAEDLVNLLTVLQAYDLVSLEGNTWKPGPALAEGRDGTEISK